MNESHRRQIDEQIARSLTLAGIKRSYHQRSLAGLADGSLLTSWVQTQAKTEVRSGAGWTIVGSGHASYDTAIVLARALHLSELPVRVVPLRLLVRLLEVDADELRALNNCAALFVMDFYQQYDKGTCPLTGAQIQEVEMFLLDRMNDARSIMLHCAKRLGPDTWWSPNLVQLVAKTNRLLEVKS